MATRTRAHHCLLLGAVALLGCAERAEERVGDRVDERVGVGMAV